MENATQALHMAFGVLVFVLALSITISSFGIVRVAATSIIEAKDKETKYTYVDYTDTSGNLETSRIVGAETIIPAMYRAYTENYTIRFYDVGGERPLNVYKFDDINTNELDLKAGGLGSQAQAKELIDSLINNKLGELVQKNKDEKTGRFTRFGEASLQKLNFSDIINNNWQFKETLGIYYQDDLEENDADDINKTEKRVITYTKI